MLLRLAYLTVTTAPFPGGANTEPPAPSKRKGAVDGSAVRVVVGVGVLLDAVVGQQVGGVGEPRVSDGGVAHVLPGGTDPAGEPPA